MSDFGSWLAQAKPELSEETLTLSDTQGNSPPFGDKLRQRLAVPKIATEPEIAWGFSQSATNLLQLLITESSWSTRPVPICQPGKAFYFKSVNPVSNGPGGIPQEQGNFCATQPLRNQQYAMQPMIVTGFIRPTNLILQGQNDILGF